jgi:hypothetical protein
LEYYIFSSFQAAADIAWSAQAESAFLLYIFHFVNIHFFNEEHGQRNCFGQLFQVGTGENKQEVFYTKGDIGFWVLGNCNSKMLKM